MCLVFFLAMKFRFQVITFDQSEFSGSSGSITNTLATNLLSGTSGSGSNSPTSLSTGSSSATSNLMNAYTPLFNSYTEILKGMMNSSSQLMNSYLECKLHVAFHGCKMGREMIQESYVQHAGYNKVADANNIIIMYPQVVKTTMNPNGCWDWWGYTDAKFDSKNGVQMRAIKAMVDRITGIAA
ncbi:hypothetical protein KUTeg_015066 [Tegillarca granosa]|uniref:Uncharacterized protein n=1 Tax=Tegillarca granosa TaxID=220873 RepID=A0ABQ9EP19_TEGGR|nr:hypothetical protein KUTeg_015066 [Tegillarca granosa]